MLLKLKAYKLSIKPSLCIIMQLLLNNVDLKGVKFFTFLMEVRERIKTSK